MLTWVSGERLNLVGGLSQTGAFAELVRTKDGKNISLRTGEEVSMEDYKLGSKRPVMETPDEDALRSMARRKKSAGAAAREEHRCRECSKIFKRPCDLTYVSPLLSYQATDLPQKAREDPLAAMEVS